jgi:hypothetical protein
VGLKKACVDNLSISAVRRRSGNDGQSFRLLMFALGSRFPS